MARLTHSHPSCLPQVCFIAEDAAAAAAAYPWIILPFPQDRAQGPSLSIRSQLLHRCIHHRPGLHSNPRRGVGSSGRVGEWETQSRRRRVTGGPRGNPIGAKEYVGCLPRLYSTYPSSVDELEHPLARPGSLLGKRHGAGPLPVGHEGLVGAQGLAQNLIRNRLHRIRMYGG